jgi:hypothetical protein
LLRAELGEFLEEPCEVRLECGHEALYMLDLLGERAMGHLEPRSMWSLPVRRICVDGRGMRLEKLLHGPGEGKAQPFEHNTRKGCFLFSGSMGHRNFLLLTLLRESLEELQLTEGRDQQEGKSFV